jgi:hypothetical protein
VADVGEHSHEELCLSPWQLHLNLQALSLQLCRQGRLWFDMRSSQRVRLRRRLQLRTLYRPAHRMLVGLCHPVRRRTQEPVGSTRKDGRNHRFSSRALQSIYLPPGVSIRSSLGKQRAKHHVQSVKERLAHRTVRGESNARRGDGAKVVCSESASHEVIVRFYGASRRCDGAVDVRSLLGRRVLCWRDCQMLCLITAGKYGLAGREEERRRK